MAIDRSKLVEFIRELKSTNIGRFDEAKTKQKIVLRILHLVGWNIFDVDEVEPEYGVSNKRVDYSLIAGNNKVFLEVKKVGEDLESHQEQLLMYAFEEGVKLAVLTNGIIWQFFLPLKEGKWEQRKFFTIDILHQDIEEAAQKFEDILSKENVMLGVAINKAEEIFESQKRHEKIREMLPKAWSKLVSEPDKKLVELLIGKVEKMCGYRPNIKDVTVFLQKQDIKVPIIETKKEEMSKVSYNKNKTFKIERPPIKRELLVESIVKVLGRFGGKAPKKQVEKEVYREFLDVFNHPSWQMLKKSGGEPVWRNTIAWAKEIAKHSGYVKRPEESGRGVWELTEKGWDYYNRIKD